MRARRDAALRVLKVMMVATVAIPAAIFCYASWVSYQNTSAHADEKLLANLGIMAEHTSRIFQSVDLTFTAIDAIAGDLTDEQIKANEAALHARLSKLEKATAAVDAIVITDADGRVLVSSAISPIPDTVGVADRDYFRVQKERDAGTYIGEVLHPRVRKEAGDFFGVSRRRPLQNGKFAGVIEVAVETKVFTEFYAQLARDAGGGGFSLARSDGMILARYPPAPNGITRFGPDSGFMLNVPRYPKGAVVTTNHSVEGVERRIAFRPLGFAQLYVSDGVSTDTIVADWLQPMAAHLYFGIPARHRAAVAGADDDAPHARALCRSRAARTRRGGPAAGAEDGSRRTIDRRRRARLQQSPDHHPRQSRHRQARRGRGARRTRAQQCADRRRAGGAIDAAPARLLAPAAARSEDRGRQQIDRQHVRPAQPLARRKYRAGNDQRRRALENRMRRFRTGIGAAQSRDQRARRHAGRRQTDHRNQQRLSGRRVLPPPRRSHARPICSHCGLRQRRGNVGRDHRARVRSVLHDQGNGQRNRPGAEPGLRFREAIQGSREDLQRTGRRHDDQALFPAA